MGRYLERAENANRHLMVASEFAVELEGINDVVALREWQSLVASMPSAGIDGAPETPRAALQYMSWFLVDRENSLSVISSLGKARENARTVSETLTLEITTSLNEAYRELVNIKKSSVSDMGLAQDLLQRTHNSVLTTLGAIEHTLTRGEGWNHMKLGEAIERTQRTLFVLRTRLPSLENWEGEVDSPLHFASWRSLLRSVASLENYRQEYGPRFVHDQVVRFILFHDTAPRAVRCGIKRMHSYLEGMPEAGPGIHESRRRLGKLLAQLEFDQDEIMHPAALMPFVDQTLSVLYDVHESITNPAGAR